MRQVYWHSEAQELPLAVCLFNYCQRTEQVHDPVEAEIIHILKKREKVVHKGMFKKADL